MKKIIITLASLLALSAPAFADQYVDGYFRQDGSYVQPHYRSDRDSSYNNNYSTSPNVNPYTGQRGNNQPTYNDRTPQYNKNQYGNPGTINTPLPQHRQNNQSIYR